MSDFVERCRREWRRLGVPADVADDMASELASDLDAAAADGLSAHDLFGSADPQALAASWAAERGVVPLQRLRVRFPARSRVVVAIATLLSVAAIAVGATLLATPTASALPLPPADSSVAFSEVAVVKLPAALPWTTAVIGPKETFLVKPGGDDVRQAVAWSLLIAGLVAFGLSGLYRLRAAVQVRRSTA